MKWQSYLHDSTQIRKSRCKILNKKEQSNRNFIHMSPLAIRCRVSLKQLACHYLHQQVTLYAPQCAAQSNWIWISNSISSKWIYWKKVEGRSQGYRRNETVICNSLLSCHWTNHSWTFDDQNWIKFLKSIHFSTLSRSDTTFCQQIGQNLC